ncbi:putative Zn-dependent peptidase [Rubidibacter lacunae KORDI 51-2]|uniref:Putative Zn-dependent peptidase n=1 Tax=Rubidibacter lacunae KORDI 51-2 TaxID=582515 RepID=U5DSB9_9CHRO|nr:pitrilysin family protein [Rubidibacter lacunae]ERN42570.1 putative Zn-dependent peptidase [Rubidibacter lacunae KORDI 51-2]
MKYRLRSLFWLGLGLFAALAIAAFGPGPAEQAFAATPRHYTELEFPPLPDVELPDYTRFQLDNGAIVYLIEDRELPLVQGTAVLRVGARHEPADRVGLARLMGVALRAGGTENHAPDELNQLLEQRAASVETRVGLDAGTASFSALSEDLETVFKLFAEVLRSPAFGPEQLELLMRQARGTIARRNDDPGNIAGREFRKLIYGEDSPYARTVEYATLARIERADVLEFYRTYVRPDNLVLGIVGDFETEKMRALVEQTFGDWQGSGPLPNLEPPPTEQVQTGGLYFVEQPQLTQSNVLLGHVGGQFDAADYPAMRAIDSLLNGFSGRLFDEVRSRRGLAYSVYAAWSADYDRPGLFVAGGQTRSQTTVPFVQAIETEIERLRSETVSTEELDNAIEAAANSFVFNFQTPRQTLSRLMRYEFYDYPENFLFESQEALQALTPKDILAAARNNLKPEQLVTVVVGNSRDIQPPLSSLDATVTALDVTIPPDPNG